MAGSDPSTDFLEAPKWLEVYKSSSVLTVYISNLHRLSHLDPQAQLLGLHRLLNEFHRVIGCFNDNTVWELNRLQQQFFYAFCPDRNSQQHADRLVNIANDLRHAATKMALPNGEAPLLQMAICSGASAAGVIGQEGLSFMLVGGIVEAAKQLSKLGGQLTVDDETWRKLSDETKALCEWRPVVLEHPDGSKRPCWMQVPDIEAAGDDVSCRPVQILPHTVAAPVVLSGTPANGPQPAPDGPCIPCLSPLADGDGAKAPARPLSTSAVRWSLLSGFGDPEVEQRFARWHAMQLGSLDAVALWVSLLVVAAAIVRNVWLSGVAGAFVPCGLLLIGAPLAVLLLQRQPELWTQHREAICCLLKFSLLVGRLLTPASTPDSTPTALLAAGILGVFDCISVALLCKPRLHVQLLYSGMLVGAQLLSSAHLHSLGVRSASDGLQAVITVVAMAVAQAALIYTWDKHLRATFVATVLGGGGKGGAALRADENGVYHAGAKASKKSA